MNPLVKAVDLSKSYGEFRALHGIDLDVAKGEVLCIIGPSGSGKSTFLRCINQLETITGGALWVNDELVGYRRVENKLYPLSEKQMARQRLATGMVFQRYTRRTVRTTRQSQTRRGMSSRTAKTGAIDDLAR